MNRLKYTLLGVLGLVFATFCSCERSGLDNDKLYVKKEFRPVANFTAEAGFGKAAFRWDLPDSTSSLQYIELCWNDTNDLPVRRVLTKYQDTIVIDSLLAYDYTFRIVSHGEKGETSAAEPVVIAVKDWQLEPPVLIKDLKMMVAENSLMLDWVNPDQRVFAGVVFEIYRGGQLAASHEVGKSEAPSYVFGGLEFRADDYELRYCSVSEKRIVSQVATTPFATGDVAPVVPEIRLYTKRLDAAHCAEFEWEETEGLDSLQIKFKDMNGVVRQYRYKGNQYGYASLLPGGTTELEIQAKGTNGTWSFPVKQKIKTKLSDDAYVHKPDQSAPRSKLAEALYPALGKGTEEDYKAGEVYKRGFSFKEMAGLPELPLRWEVRLIEEIELCCNLETLVFKSFGGMTADNAPKLQDLLTLVDRLVHIKEVQMVANYPNFRVFQQGMANHPKVKFKKI